MCWILNSLHSMKNNNEKSFNILLSLFYRFFCGELFTKGICKWRVLSESRNVVVMNDYDCETGNFFVSFINIVKICNLLITS